MKRKGLLTILGAGVVVWIAGAFETIHATDAEIARSSVDGGGAMMSVGGVFELSGTIGQPDSSLSSGGDLSVSGGFWFEQVPADCNTDGGVNLYDFASFEECKSGPGGGLPDPSCVCFDLDFDGDVDLLDWNVFQRSFGG